MKKKINVIIIIQLILIVIISCACKSEKEQLPDNIDSCFTLILFDSNSNLNHINYNENMILYSEKLLKEEGIDVKIEIYTPDYSVLAKDTLTDQFFEVIQKQYLDYYETRLKSSENILFSINTLYNEENEILINNGLVADISKYESILLHYGNENYFYNKYPESIYSEKDEKYAIPIGYGRTSKYFGIYVRKNIMDDYGKKLESIDDYEKLLEWIKNGDYNLKPSAIPLTFNFEKNIMDFFAQADGYINAETFLNANTMNCFYLKENTIDNMASINSFDIRKVTDEAFFYEMDIKLTKWQESDLSDLFLFSDEINLNNYASIILDSYDYTSYSTNNVNMNVNMNDFNVYFLSDNDISSTPMYFDRVNNSLLGISNNSQNPEGIYCFLNWIYSDKDNYYKFMYGKEDIDYVLDADSYITLIGDKENNYGLWEPKSIFKLSYYDKIKTVYPNNWYEYLNATKDILSLNLSSIAIDKGMSRDDYGNLADETIYNESIKPQYVDKIHNLYRNYFNSLIDGKTDYNISNLFDDINYSAEIIAYEEELKFMMATIYEYIK